MQVLVKLASILVLPMLVQAKTFNCLDSSNSGHLLAINQRQTEAVVLSQICNIEFTDSRCQWYEIEFPSAKVSVKGDQIRLVGQEQRAPVDWNSPEYKSRCYVYRPMIVEYAFSQSTLNGTIISHTEAERNPAMPGCTVPQERVEHGYDLSCEPY